MIIAILCWGLGIAGFGLTGGIVVGVLMLALAGAADSVSSVFRNTIMQVATPDEMRGRLQGVFVVVVAGGPRLGDFLAGSVADVFGLRVALIAGGLMARRTGAQMRGELFGVPPRSVREQELADLAAQR